MGDLQELTNELMQDPEFVKEYKAIQSEVNRSRAILNDTRSGKGHEVITLDEFIEEQLKDPVFKEKYEALESEFTEMQAKIDGREDFRVAFNALREEASDLPNMTLEEINAEIEASRRERKLK